MYDVAIIGGGVVGGMLARTLSAYKLKICILEKENDVAMGATKSNSAIVHAGVDAKEGSLKANLNVRGSEMMENLCKELALSIATTAHWSSALMTRTEKPCKRW